MVLLVFSMTGLGYVHVCSASEILRISSNIIRILTYCLISLPLLFVWGCTRCSENNLMVLFKFYGSVALFYAGLPGESVVTRFSVTPYTSVQNSGL